MWDCHIPLLGNWRHYPKVGEKCDLTQMIFSRQEAMHYIKILTGEVEHNIVDCVLADRLGSLLKWYIISKNGLVIFEQGKVD